MSFFKSISLRNDFNIYRFVTDTFASNCYVIEYKKYYIIIDPGERLSLNVVNWFLKYNKIPDYCLLTHEHFDHLIGYKNLTNRFNLKTYCSDETKNAIKNSSKNLSFYHNIPFEYNISNRIDKLPDFIKVLKTPGHSKGSVSFLIENCLFSGDTILENKQHMTSKLPGGNKNDLKESVILINGISKSFKLFIFPGHGDIFEYKKLNFI